jgi:alkylhydroperoxidase/carboxymuconolactone decarboxylase family protein YurZ
MLGIDDEFVEKSLEEMEEDMKSLLKESERLKMDASALLRRSDDLRNRSVDLRPQDPEAAEDLWQESEELRAEARKMMGLSVDAALRAGEIKHRIEIHDQIVAVVDRADEIWKGAIRGGRS